MYPTSKGALKRLRQSPIYGMLNMKGHYNIGSLGWSLPILRSDHKGQAVNSLNISIMDVLFGMTLKPPADQNFPKGSASLKLVKPSRKYHP